MSDPSYRGQIVLMTAPEIGNVGWNDEDLESAKPRAAGFVVRMENDRALYFAGDTALFGDMRLIRELHAPEIAFLPIGDHFTMDPVAAAKACEMLGVKQVVPMHYGTFPLLTGRPEDLKKLVEAMGIDVLVLKPGETAQ